MPQTTRIMKKGAIVLPAVFLLLSGLPYAQAQNASRDEQTKACKKDALRLCTLYIPNERKITACMQKKFDQLSPGCQAMFKPEPPAKGKAGKKTKSHTE